MRRERVGMGRMGVAAMCAAAMTLGLVAVSSASAAPARVALPKLARAEVAHYQAPLAPGVTPDCQAPAGDATPGTQAWDDRDRANQYCATERLQDEYANPAFGSTFWSYTPGRYAQQNVDMALQDQAASGRPRRQPAVRGRARLRGGTSRCHDCPSRRTGRRGHPL